MQAVNNFITKQIQTDLATHKYSKIITRFPPEPNGHLHIGHAKAICLNFGVAEDFAGTCNLRFDDTNPSKESQEYIEAIKTDVKWLGFNWHNQIKFTSNYFDQLFACAIELIEQGLAFVCFLTPELAKNYRGSLIKSGTESPYRFASIADNLANFKKMQAGGFVVGECVLRAKIDMNSPFMCLRDPVIYRILNIHHHQTKNKWCIYPMYDFAQPISDAIEHVSHSLCTLEFQDNRRLYDWYLQNLTVGTAPRPYQYEFARLNLEHTLMSKRKLQNLVEGKLVSGWDDPRMPTISAMRRRGFPPQAIVDFCKTIGISKQDSNIGMEILENIVRDNLNLNAVRTMAVLEPVSIIIENRNGNLETLIAANHPQNPDMGTRTINFSNQLFIEREDFRMAANKKYKRLVLGKEVRLRNAYVIKANRVEQNSAGEISTIYCSYDPETLGKNPSDGRKIKGVIHFVEATTAIKAEMHLYDRLFSAKTLAKLDDFSDAINPNAKIIKSGVVEPAMQAAAIGVTWQFERLGYFCRDSQSDKLVFNRTVSLRDT